MRKIGSLTIQFGLVNIPMGINSFIQHNEISFRQLHKECGNPINYKKWCNACGKEVSNDEIVSGYKVGKDKYIIIDKSQLEFENFETKVVAVIERDSEPEYLAKAFYILTPIKPMEKAYFLLRDLLLLMNKELVIEYMLRKKVNLAIIKPINVKGKVLLLLKHIVYPEYVLLNETDLNNFHEIEVVKEELELAKQLFEKIFESVKNVSYNDLKDKRKEVLREILSGNVKKVDVKENIQKFKSLFEALKESVEAYENERKIKEKS